MSRLCLFIFLLSTDLCIYFYFPGSNGLPYIPPAEEGLVRFSSEGRGGEGRPGAPAGVGFVTRDQVEENLLRRVGVVAVEINCEGGECNTPLNSTTANSRFITSSVSSTGSTPGLPAASSNYRPVLVPVWVHVRGISPQGALKRQQAAPRAVYLL